MFIISLQHKEATMATIVGKVFKTAEAQAPAVVEAEKKEEKKEEVKTPGFLKKK